MSLRRPPSPLRWLAGLDARVAPYGGIRSSAGDAAGSRVQRDRGGHHRRRWQRRLEPRKRDYSARRRRGLGCALWSP
jgi:hypothetical protein